MTGATLDAVKLSALVEDGMAAVERAMIQATDSDVEVLREASLHILGAGGKRIRPRLLLLTYLALGGRDVDYVADPAAAIELMHTASVVHDDINDHGILRRGRPSVNAIWGRPFALLTGDFLFTAVYELMAPYQELNVDLAKAATGLVEGETLQASAVKNNTFTREAYMRIIARKTAALFRAASTIGAKLAGSRPDETRILSDFGYNLGIAFQIVDDILDLVSDQDKLGKTSGVDITQGRGVAVAMNDANGNGRAQSVDPLDEIRRKLMDGDTIKTAREQARYLIDSSIASLAILDESPAKSELIDLARQVIERDS
ncbi:MAG: polyprenyl synthetase family protein [Chloroflexota bacterium]|nr:polyprenyl synthetase family protein [Chloroflexota bacterium]